MVQGGKFQLDVEYKYHDNRCRWIPKGCCSSWKHVEPKSAQHLEQAFGSTRGRRTTGTDRP